MKKKVTLIYPRFRYPSGDFSLGLAYIGAYLRENIKDIEVSLIDTTFNPFLDYVKQKLEELMPEVALIYSDTLMFNDAVNVSKLCKTLNINVMMGGPHATVLPEISINIDTVDAICIGEGECASAEYINEFYGNKRFENVQGIWFRKGSNIVKNHPRPVIDNIDTLPYPAIDLYDIEQYTKYFVQLDDYKANLKGISIIASRGCPYQCSFCQPTLRKIFGQRLRIRSPENIVAEMKQLKSRYNISAFYFQDDTLTVFKDWIKHFCTLLKQEDLNVVWACNTRADTYDYEILKLMKESGCVKIKVGIESITDRIRNGIYKKNISREQIDNLLRDAKKLDIHVAGFFMLGAPTETETEIWDTIRFAVGSTLVEANFSITTPFPKTSLYNYIMDHGWIVPCDYSCFDYYKVKRPQMSKGDVSIKRLSFLKKFANFYFYLHPKRFFNTFKQCLNIKKFLLKLKRL